MARRSRRVRNKSPLLENALRNIRKGAILSLYKLQKNSRTPRMGYHSSPLLVRADSSVYSQ
jgi:hypothetical protein